MYKTKNLKIIKILRFAIIELIIVAPERIIFSFQEAVYQPLDFI